MWILRAPVRIALLHQGPKLGRQGTAKGMKIGNVWWVRKRKRFWCEFCARLPGSHFCCKDQNLDPRDNQRNENGKCLMGKKTETTFMWILRAPVSITLLPQGSKLGPQGTIRRMKMGNVWWSKKHKRLLCAFCERLPGSHFCRQDPSWGVKGQPKEWTWEVSDG